MDETLTLSLKKRCPAIFSVDSRLPRLPRDIVVANPVTKSKYIYENEVENFQYFFNPEFDIGIGITCDVSSLIYGND
jgi:hypothetical protein